MSGLMYTSYKNNQSKIKHTAGYSQLLQRIQANLDLIVNGQKQTVKCYICNNNKENDGNLLILLFKSCITK